jgi:hypothetical protein
MVKNRTRLVLGPPQYKGRFLLGKEFAKDV